MSGSVRWICLLFCASAFAGTIERNLYKGKLGKASSVKGIDCIYLINLDERKDRLRVMKKSGISFVRFPAINGWKRFPGDHMAGHYGCLLSHLSIYRDALKKGYQRIWVLEDDVVVVGRLKKLTLLMNDLHIIVQGWDVLFTGRDTVVNRNKRRNYLLPFGKRFAKVSNRHGMFSAIISRSGIKKIYEYYLKYDCINRPIDREIYRIFGLKIYTTMENFVLHTKEGLHSSNTHLAP